MDAKNSYPTRKIVSLLLIISFFTVSFDIFLVLEIGPNIRAFQFITLLPIFYSFMLLLNRPIIIPLGFIPLLAWMLFIFLFIPNSGYIPKGIGYAFWLFLNVLLIFALVQIINFRNFYRIFFWYITSFFFVAAFGLLQFIFALIGFGEMFLIKTWFIQDIFPRINGFSYEPSFFSTYLMPGWILIIYLLNSNINFINRRLLKFYFFAISLAIILSGSRMGWLVIFLVLAVFSLKIIYKFICLKPIKVKYFYMIFLLCLFIFGYYLATNVAYFSILTSGLSGEAASVNLRLKSTIDTFIVFFDSPFIGYSLGGVSSAIANLNNLSIDDFASAKIEGNMVLAEVLAASGIIGFLPFIIFLWSIFIKPFFLIRMNKSNDLSIILYGIILATLIQFFMLQFNQNILRPYFWLNIAMLCVVYNLYKKKLNNE
jgi:O-antigen ligase